MADARGEEGEGEEKEEGEGEGEGVKWSLEELRTEFLSETNLHFTN